MEGLEGTEGVEGAHALPPPLFPPPPFPPPPSRGTPRGRRTYAPPFPATLPMTPLAPGTLLVAEPPMPDPNFRRTVVLLCDHTTEGSFGLVLNRPCDFRLAEVAALPFDAALGFGGPVQMDTLHYVHPYGALIEDAHPVVDDVWRGGDFEALTDGVEGGWLDAAAVRFFVGYSGWGAGQLDAEVDEGSWIVLPA